MSSRQTPLLTLGNGTANDTVILERPSARAPTRPAWPSVTDSGRLDRSSSDPPAEYDLVDAGLYGPPTQGVPRIRASGSRFLPQRRHVCVLGGGPPRGRSHRS